MLNHHKIESAKWKTRKGDAGEHLLSTLEVLRFKTLRTFSATENAPKEHAISHF